MPTQTTGLKRCRRCNVEKEITQNFYTVLGKYYVSYCKPCSALQSAEYRAANVVKLQEQRRANRVANPEKYRRMESERYNNSPGVRLSREARDKPCADCGVRLPPQIMELDHVRGQKLFSVGGSLLRHRNEAEVREEIAKCEVRCPNCHKLRHYHERQERKASNG